MLSKWKSMPSWRQRQPFSLSKVRKDSHTTKECSLPDRLWCKVCYAWASHVTSCHKLHFPKQKDERKRDRNRGRSATRDKDSKGSRSTSRSERDPRPRKSNDSERQHKDSRRNGSDSSKSRSQANSSRNDQKGGKLGRDQRKGAESLGRGQGDKGKGDRDRRRGKTNTTPERNRSKSSSHSPGGTHKSVISNNRGWISRGTFVKSVNSVTRDTNIYFKFKEWQMQRRRYMSLQTRLPRSSRPHSLAPSSKAT